MTTVDDLTHDRFVTAVAFERALRLLQSHDDTARPWSEHLGAIYPEGVAELAAELLRDAGAPFESPRDVARDARTIWALRGPFNVSV